MSDITNTKWKPFIKLNLVDPSKETGGFSGYAVLDVNQKVNMVWNDDSKFTLVIIGDGKTTFAVKETPDEICTLVDTEIDRQVEKAKKEHEEFMAAYEAKQATGE